jgi:hypothetical protein
MRRAVGEQSSKGLRSLPGKEYPHHPKEFSTNTEMGLKT